MRRSVAGLTAIALTLALAPTSLYADQIKSLAGGATNKSETPATASAEDNEGKSLDAIDQAASEAGSSEPEENQIGDSSSDSGVAATDTSVESSGKDSDVKTVPLVSSVLRPASASKAITTVGGPTRYETSALQALDGWSSSDWAIVAGGETYADSICASGLAGALGCPVLLTGPSYVPDVIADALAKLGVKHVIVLGGTDVVSQSVQDQLSRLTGNDAVRLAGPTRYETQMEVYEYGLRNGLWGSDAAIISYGMNFADALAVSPLAYKLKAPVFYASGDGTLPATQKAALASGAFGSFIVTGGGDVVSGSVTNWLSALGPTVRLGGDTRFETSIEIARYAVSNCGMTWDGMAFASGYAPYDALGGGALQGSLNSVLVLKNPGDTTGACIPSGSNPTSYRYFGGSAIYPDAFKVLMAKKSGFDPNQIDGVSFSTGGNWYYIGGQNYLWNGSDWTRGWSNADGTRFFEYDTGAMHTGWYYENGQYYDFGSDGVWVPTHYHNIEWAGQPNNYYCGPTSGFMILRNVGAWTSAWGDGLNIWNVASYMHTDAYGYTSFQDRWFMRGMNNWLGWNCYTSVHTPSYETVRNAIMGSYVNGYATVLDEQERRGGPHFNGHNNGTFAHIMVVDGYNQNDDSVYICDPGAPTLWPSGSSHFWYWSLRDFVQTYMQNEINGARERIGVHYAWY